MAAQRIPSVWIASRVLEWQARRIQDPVARLRFLRRVTPWTSLPVPRFDRRLALGGVAAMVAILILPFMTRTARAWRVEPRHSMPRPSTAISGKVPDVWLVEQKGDSELYSSGLRIEGRSPERVGPRRYAVLDRTNADRWTRLKPHEIQWRTQPSGIVYHTTESHIAPFEKARNAELSRAANGLISYVRGMKAYHYVIDRFGRVHRVVAEDSPANHAGWSIWADADYAYLNLNNSFFGIAFEAQTRPQDGSETISPGQIRAGQMLTELLRHKYKIAAANCVTHGQVSVNPDALLVGAHVDWAARFPFAAMGLPDNYAQPIPSISLFGFQYDNVYVSMSEASLWKGLLLADAELRLGAARKNSRLPHYRASLNRRYKDLSESIQRMKTEDGK